MYISTKYEAEPTLLIGQGRYWRRHSFLLQNSLPQWDWVSVWTLPWLGAAQCVVIAQMTGWRRVYNRERDYHHRHSGRLPFVTILLGSAKSLLLCWASRCADRRMYSCICAPPSWFVAMLTIQNQALSIDERGPLRLVADILFFRIWWCVCFDVGESLWEMQFL